ncbi:MAG: hypothetical protein ACJ76D_01460 [Solirubrobacterales bacterium]
MGHGKEGRDLTHLYAEALSHPLRILILRFSIKEGKASPAQMSRGLNQDLPKVAYHTRVLADHGLLRLATTRKVRGAIEHIYSPVESTLAHPVVMGALIEGEAPPSNG